MRKIYSLKFKSLAMIFIAVAVTVKVLGAIVIYTEFKYSELQLRNLTKRIVDNQSESLAVALWYVDYKMVSQMVNSWDEDPDIYSIKVRGDGGDIIASLQRDPKDYAIDFGIISLIDENDFFTLHKDIMYKNQKMGSATFVVSKKRLYQEAQEHLEVGFIILLILLLFISLLTYLSVNWLITKPLIYLVREMLKITKGKFSDDIKYVSRQDEIGVMAKALLVFKDNAKVKIDLEKAQQKIKNEQRLKEIEYLNSLKMSKEKAEAASVAKSEFLANMSHELRTPLNGVLGMLSVLENDKLTPEQKENVNIAKSSSSSLLALINDILDFSKIESGSITLESHAFDVRDLLKEVFDVVYFQVKEKKLKLNFYIDKEVPDVVQGDSFRLKQILLNLTNNAVKFTDEGEVNVIVQLDSSVDECCRLKIFVLDSGIGIRQEDLPKLFARFSQADSADNRKHSGTGLGLVIAQKLAQMMNGDIKVSSIFEVGTIFCVNVCLKSVSTPKPYQEEGTCMQRNLNAIVVLENEQYRKHISGILSVAGMNVLESSILNSPAIFDFENKVEEQEQVIDYVFIEDGYLKAYYDSVSDISHEHPLFTEVIRILPAGTEMKNDDLYIQEDISPTKMKDFFVKYLDLEKLETESMSKHDDVEEETADDLYLADFGSKNVLIAEDNKVNQLVVSKFLEKYNFNIDFAEDGLVAIDKFKQADYDLILMDCQMPNCDGYQATKEIKKIQLEIGKKSTIIALTAKVFAEDRQACLDAGMDDVVLKPINAEILDLTLRKWRII
tara:strand:+ start:768 stop:3113 length:2346 start_codon:yes stop_codon:yes gene_type:complete